jgi:hypothetical protein
MPTYVSHLYFNLMFHFLFADGDFAWICWNDELLKCLPKSIQEGHHVFESEIPPRSDGCMWSSSSHDILNYNWHFRYHLQTLGRYSELLDVFIDKYGFDDDRTISVGKAAFLQVSL